MLGTDKIGHYEDYDEAIKILCFSRCTLSKDGSACSQRKFFEALTTDAKNVSKNVHRITIG